ncbi:MAG: relaxase/mobilization nuclease domain-containing protein [Gammaproteobacteria bacterium]|nr:relaxase/mobilization nuclease domain-containing protein [Gammaproteobacteria bacterium]
MRTFKLRTEEPLLNIASHARGGSRAADRLTPAQIEHIRLTVNRAPEVMVKVLSKGSSDLKAVGRHFDYIGRQGDLALEDEDGHLLHGRVGEELIDDWDLDIDALRPQVNLTALPARKPMKLVHKLVFSMPPGTPPQKVLAAVRNFAREEFHGQHRYAMVLHTDEPHPHVHLVLRALSNECVRLNIRKATLRHWRAQFAEHLRGVGVAANATERAVRGESRKALKDGIYRASLRGASTLLRERVEAVASELANGSVRPEAGKRTLTDTRAVIQSGWRVVANRLALQGDQRLAADISRFAEGMDRPLTDREWIARGLLAQVRVKQREARTL